MRPTILRNSRIGDGDAGNRADMGMDMAENGVRMAIAGGRRAGTGERWVSRIRIGQPNRALPGDAIALEISDRRRPHTRCS